MIELHPYLQVNTNGVLTFDQPFYVPLPRPFPDNSLRKISPFWENIDTSRDGRIYYRNTTDITLLRRAQYHLQDIFPSARGFFPSYLFIATWDETQELGLTGDTSLVSFIAQYARVLLCVCGRNKSFGKFKLKINFFAGQYISGSNSNQWGEVICVLHIY